MKTIENLRRHLNKTYSKDRIVKGLTCREPTGRLSKGPGSNQRFDVRDFHTTSYRHPHVKTLEQKHGCTATRIQEINLAEPLDFLRTAGLK